MVVVGLQHEPPLLAVDCGCKASAMVRGLTIFDGLGRDHTGVFGNLVHGCRALALEYANATKASGEADNQRNEHKGRLKEVLFVAWSTTGSLCGDLHNRFWGPGGCDSSRLLTQA